MRMRVACWPQGGGADTEMNEVIIRGSLLIRELYTSGKGPRSLFIGSGY